MEIILEMLKGKQTTYTSPMLILNIIIRLTHCIGKISLFLLCYNLKNAHLTCALTNLDIPHSSNVVLPLGAVPVFRKGWNPTKNKNNITECC